MIRNAALTLATLITVAAVSVVAPSVSQAQGTQPGQIVQGVAKLNQAQLAFAKQLANDPLNLMAAAGLVAAASGMTKSAIRVGPKGSNGMGDDDAASASTEQKAAFRLASFERTPRSKVTASVICFNLGVVSGCFIWN